MATVEWAILAWNLLNQNENPSYTILHSTPLTPVTPCNECECLLPEARSNKDKAEVHLADLDASVAKLQPIVESKQSSEDFMDLPTI